ncbi:MAG TPA: hypothetical protein VMV31_14505 [Terriglobales bacterium]|nr:hypothetical protein [Terriglobales bacterium]
MIRITYWPDDAAWTGEDQGWFKSPRSLPLLMALLRSKPVSGKKDPSSVYLDLLSRHYGEGVIEMAHEKDHAYAAGYVGSRAVRTWQERMRILADAGFIRIQAVGGQPYKYVLLVHPGRAVEQLKRQDKVHAEWLSAYADRKRTTREPDYKTAPPKSGPPGPTVPGRGRKLGLTKKRRTQ